MQLIKLTLLFWIFSISKNYCQTFLTESHTDSNGYTYEAVTNDPTGLRLYTLKNGLKVYLAQSYEEPRIRTVIAVRAGSNQDPADNTGLAHYLEHLLFNGTDSFGTLDWEQEQPLLNEISRLFEEHKREKDPEKKKEIYKNIDSVSFKASKYGIRNEYRRLAESIGAVTVNGLTDEDRTIYVGLIPSTTLEKFLVLESERFKKVVMRSFHTELEIVYEEFNRGQDQVFRRKHYLLMSQLFKKHPYGFQRPIGTSEHLKNPSIVSIQQYFDKYYIPNNMAIILVGDLQFDTTIKLVDQAFGNFKSKNLKPLTFPQEDPIEKPIEVEISGPDEESVLIGFRNNGANSEDEKYITLIDQILYNGVSGLFDTELIGQQKVKNATSRYVFDSDYGIYTIDGYPKEGQSLEQVKNLMLSQIERIKKGDYEDWLLKAAINDLKKLEKGKLSKGFNLDGEYMMAFIHRQKWSDRLSFMNKIEHITKGELTTFANNFFKNNYVVVYKRKGESSGVIKVDNPKITPILSNRDSISIFAKNFNKLKIDRTKPQFLDYNQEIQKVILNNKVTVEYVQNKKNDLFELDVIFDMGKNDNKLIPLAVNYLNYAGTDKYSLSALKNEFYKAGVSFNVNATNLQTTFHLEGLQEGLAKGIQLLDHILTSAIWDEPSYSKYIAGIIQGRINNKTIKNNILYQGLQSYALYNELSPLRDIYSEEELKKINPDDLMNFIHSIRNYKHRIFYYGKDLSGTVQGLNTYYKANPVKEYPARKFFSKIQTKPVIYFVDFDMVQAEILLVTAGKKFDRHRMGQANLSNWYLGKIINQKIREERSLAYTTGVTFTISADSVNTDHFSMYAGTQANKLSETLKVMIENVREFPAAENEFREVKEDLLKRYENERIRGTDIFWRFENLKRQGITYDIREDMYSTIKKMELQDIKNFFNENISNQNITILIIGNKKDIDMKGLSRYGEVKEMDVNYLFNYN